MFSEKYYFHDIESDFYLQSIFLSFAVFHWNAGFLFIHVLHRVRRGPRGFLPLAQVTVHIVTVCWFLRLWSVSQLNVPSPFNF